MLNDNIADIEKADGISLLTFVVDNFHDYSYIHQSFPLNIKICIMILYQIFGIDKF